MIYKYIMSNFYNMRNILETEFNFICKCFMWLKWVYLINPACGDMEKSKDMGTSSFD